MVLLDPPPDPPAPPPEHAARPRAAVAIAAVAATVRRIRAERRRDGRDGRGSALNCMVDVLLVARKRRRGDDARPFSDETPEKVFCDCSLRGADGSSP
jgi:hypothetical protein